MTEEEFKKWLWDNAFTALLSDESGYRPYVDADDVRALFARLRAEREWVPVSERLPERCQRVLVHDPSIPKFPRNDNHTVIGYYRGQDHFSGGDWLIPDGLGKLTHWMPLPPPPPLPETKEPHDS